LQNAREERDRLLIGSENLPPGQQTGLTRQDSVEVTSRFPEVTTGFENRQGSPLRRSGNPEQHFVAQSLRITRHRALLLPGHDLDGQDRFPPPSGDLRKRMSFEKLPEP